uniref:Uncharacterized protein n=1 Tax=Hydrodictyon reticulatum TaxID=3107 RepID=A0A1W5RN69_HYDRE|nr:hypothetical protein [Hydrodictyon reticulatum]AQU64592.1 hypothetical protein [Hydrodictyon reticulatum]
MSCCSSPSSPLCFSFAAAPFASPSSFALPSFLRSSFRSLRLRRSRCLHSSTSAKPPLFGSAEPLFHFGGADAKEGRRSGSVLQSRIAEKRRSGERSSCKAEEKQSK